MTTGKAKSVGNDEGEVLAWIEEQFSKRYGAEVKLCAFDYHSANLMIKSMESYVNVIEDEELKEHAVQMLMVFYQIEESYKTKE